jgi:hypothetical protein
MVGVGLAFWGSMFWFATMLGTIVYMAGSVLLGIATLRAGSLPGWGAGALIVSPSLGVLLVFWGMHHLPSSFVFSFGMGWLVVGHALLTRRVEITRPRAAAG